MVDRHGASLFIFARLPAPLPSPSRTVLPELRSQKLPEELLGRFTRLRNRRSPALRLRRVGERGFMDCVDMTVVFTQPRQTCMLADWSRDACARQRLPSPPPRGRMDVVGLCPFFFFFVFLSQGTNLSVVCFAICSYGSQSRALLRGARLPGAQIAGGARRRFSLAAPPRRVPLVTGVSWAEGGQLRNCQMLLQQRI